RLDSGAVQLTVPLGDWGVRKGKVNMARNNLNVSEIAARQEELTVEEDILMTLSDYNARQQLIASAAEALDLAEMAYGQTMQRFIIGKADLNTITLSLQRRQEASKNYISALQNFWLSHYKIRRLTLYDFDRGLPIVDALEL
ncbi:MAG: TolC family protein, partial [Muribaculaceae bacterium]|nr:TolC family protein [Muribaculaceae bacterium]